MISRPRTFSRYFVLAALAFGATGADIDRAAASERQNIIAGYATEAKAQSPEFKAFSAARGQTLFLSRHSGGKPETPSCTACHTADATRAGQTRAGKIIEPMALSRSPGRYAELKKIEKWFRRNCKSVLGRACTALEKGDYLAFMTNQ